MGLLDIIVIVLVLLAVGSRFTKFKLPKDPRDSSARRSDLDRLRGRPLMRDDKPEPVDVTAEAEATRSAPRKPTLKESKELAKGLSGIAKIKALEPSFDEDTFLEGAKAAYGHFYTCWNAKDEEGLEDLCAPALMGRITNELNDKSWQPVLIDDMTHIGVAEARVHGRTSVIEVDFEALEREGTSAPRAVKRRWVLARPLGSEDPNWELEDIKLQPDS